MRIPVAALSGGQRQTVAIARVLLGDPKLIMLDEPTAALGVAQTAEVLNLIERLRETGLGVILISHNMADVQAVADRIVSCGSAATTATSTSARPPAEELVAAITGATDNAVSPGAPPRGASPERPGAASTHDVAQESTMSDTNGPGDPAASHAALPADLPGRAADRAAGLRRRRCAPSCRRLRSGDLGSLPSSSASIVIWTSSAREPGFLSSAQPREPRPCRSRAGRHHRARHRAGAAARRDRPVGRLGQRPVGRHRWRSLRQPRAGRWSSRSSPASPSARSIGCFYGALYTRFGVPSFVITLAGLLGFLGLQLYVLGKNGSINLPFDSRLVQFAAAEFLPTPWPTSWSLVVAAGTTVGRAPLRTPAPRGRALDAPPSLPR